MGKIKVAVNALVLPGEQARGVILDRAKSREILIRDNFRAANDDIELYLDTWMDWQEAQENIQRCGNIVMHPRTGSPIPNPYINIKAQSAATLRLNDTLRVKRLWLSRA